MKNLSDLTKQELRKLYWKNGQSLDDIALEYGCNKETIRRRMVKWKIPRREASQVRRNVKVDNEFLDLNRELIEDLKSLKPVKYKFKDKENLMVPLPLKYFKDGKKREARLTVVISDLHLGDTDHLPETYWSAINNLIEILKVLNKRLKIPHINLILNGDMVCGRNVFRFQEFRTLVPRSHWQLGVIEMVIRDTIDKIGEVLPTKDVIVLKGTHEQQGENYSMYLKKALDSAKYGGHFYIHNLGEDIGNYNLLVTHGYGSSEYFPIGYSLVRDLWKAINQYKIRQIPVERVCIGHYHWLSVDSNFESFTLDCTGGFQRWEKTVSQRPSGLLLYLFYDGEISVIPVKPNQEIFSKELNDPALEYKNLAYYGKLLLKHLEKVEKINL